jgi:transposase
MEKLPDLNGLTSAEKDALIIALYELVNQLRLELEQYKDQVAKNSQNSSKPPSTDGLSKPEPKSLRKPSQKKTGGQKEHEGHCLKAVVEPDHLEYHKVTHCAHCTQSLERVTEQGFVAAILNLKPHKYKCLSDSRKISTLSQFSPASKPQSLTITKLIYKIQRSDSARNAVF